MAKLVTVAGRLTSCGSAMPCRCTARCPASPPVRSATHGLRRTILPPVPNTRTTFSCSTTTPVASWATTPPGNVATASEYPSTPVLSRWATALTAVASAKSRPVAAPATRRAMLAG